MGDAPISPRYGRLLGDFQVGATYAHPWEVTLDDGLCALAASSFQDATPTYASAELARALGFRGRPVHPLVALNLALSFSVHDVSEQAIAHLAYVDVRFPDAVYRGDTVRARSTVLGVKPASSGDKGVVHVRTVLVAQDGRVGCAFERKALVRGGSLSDRPADPPGAAPPAPPLPDLRPFPAELEHATPPIHFGFSRLFEDFEVGQVYAHAVGHTVGESEHMMLTTLFRNSHPLHFDEIYAKEHSFAKTRVVYGGLVFAWVAAAASRDVAGNALWELSYAGGAHPAGVVAGDTLYAASKVLAVEEAGPAVGRVTFALVGLKNETARSAASRHGDALFEEELQKAHKLPEKVFETRRTLLVRRRPA